jgi:hypothetical protein
MSRVAGARHCCAIVAAQAFAASTDGASIHATVAIISTNRCALREFIQALRPVRSAVPLPGQGAFRPGDWRDGRTWDAQLDPEGSERRDRRPSSELRGELFAARCCTTALAAVPRDFGVDRWYEAVTPP